MEIFVDADACPVKEIVVTCAKTRKIPVTMLFDTSHVYADGYSRVITVDKGRDSVDVKLVNLLRAGDVVVTQDFGVAAMALGKGALAINQNGLVFTCENIDRLLFERFLGQKVRRSGGKTKGVKKRSSLDDEVFLKAFEKLLASRGQGK